MSLLIFVRHGQAAFLQDDYDQLSRLGRQQAKQLAHYFQGNQIRFDAIYSGPRVRQIDTANLVRESMIANGLEAPQVSIIPEFDEHQIDLLILNHIDQVLEASADIRHLHDAFQNSDEVSLRHRNFQLLFEAAANLWMEGLSFDIEPWIDFKKRINLAVDQIVSDTSRGQKVGVFTSVGPITVAIQRALRCSDQVALQTGWRIRNCSLTDFLFSGKRFTLNSFNGLPHLDHSLWTYR